MASDHDRFFTLLPSLFSALATLTDNTLTNNKANKDQTIGITIGGSSPKKMAISGMVCHDNTPKAVCADPR